MPLQHFYLKQWFVGENTNKGATSLINRGWYIGDLGFGITSNAKCNPTALEYKSATLTTITLFPNPVKDKLTIQFLKPSYETLNYSVFTSTGSLAFEKEINGNGLTEEIELDAIQHGVYFIKIKLKENIIVQSFVKE